MLSFYYICQNCIENSAVKKILLYLVFATFLFASCDESDHNEPKLNNRTVIFYLVADNSLSKITSINVQELLEGTTKDRLNNGNLILYIDNKNELPHLLQIKIENGKAVKKKVKEYEEQDSTDPVVMKRVIADILKDYKAKSYGLVLWSHSSAWMPKDTGDLISSRSFGVDYENEMDIDVLSNVLNESALHFDFILFDACYMGSIEVVYELRKVTDYLLVSPMEVIDKGFPYRQIVGELFNTPAGVKRICEDFYNYYNVQSGDYRTASVALVNTKKIEELSSVMNSIISNHKADLGNVDLNRIQALEYNYSKRLLYDFNDYVRKFASVTEYSTFQKALAEVVVYKANTPTSYFAQPEKSYRIEECCGLTVYPFGFHPRLDDWYKRLEWYQDVFN